MMSDYDHPRSDRAIEPPGFLGMHYGKQTPVIALIAHTIYGAVLGGTLPGDCGRVSGCVMDSRTTEVPPAPQPVSSGKRASR